jgi:hypothetical protein
VKTVFLAEQPGGRPWEIPDGGRPGFEAGDLFLGPGVNPLEVAVSEAASRPNVSDVRALWKRRKSNRPSPVLLVVLYPSGSGERRATICGPVGEDPAVHAHLDAGQVERLAAAALAEPDRHAAIRFLGEAMPELDSELPGIRNQGMFASHELRDGVPQRADWDDMGNWGRKVLPLRGRDLVGALGFAIEDLGTSTSILRIDESGQRAAVAVFLDDTESPDGISERFGGSPVGAALEKANAERLPWVVLTRGSQIRVYAAGPHSGVGRKGRAETFIEANVALLPDEAAAYLPLLFGAPALAEGGTFEEILERSKDFSVRLGERLRERVYQDVVPPLARAIASRHSGEVTDQALADLYEETMVALFRLLFIAYAEDKDLLPHRQNGLYQRHSLKTLARDLSERVNRGADEFDPSASDLWKQAQMLWRAIGSGNRDWGVPEYGGTLFSDDPDVNPAGAALATLDLSNAEFGPAVTALLVDRAEVSGPVDFRSLSVREFGTIYEGLLESSLAVATTDLAVKGDAYVTAAPGDTVVEPAGSIYLHNRSGLRKVTGSYFTKPFAVEHLLRHALEPALDAHLAEIDRMLDEGDEHAAAEKFFDFRVADIAMGSGHFLVAAVDRIGDRFSNYLSRRPIAGVRNELERLRAAAADALGELGSTYEIEDAALLRRQVARRCIYGVDLTPVAVELARLGLWIHTFVPGLPLSFLDHNLVEGNSLTGIGTLSEAIEALVPPKTPAGMRRGLAGTIRDTLDLARPALERLRRSADATAAEVRDARAEHLKARQEVQFVADLFDLGIAARIGAVGHLARFDPDYVVQHPSLPAARRTSQDLRAIHLPTAYPEVFIRDPEGFDVIVGNPPWEKVMAETGTFWSLRFPGLRSKPVGEMNKEIERLQRERPDLADEFAKEREQTDAMRRVLLTGPYPGMGSGHPDLYKAFAWRFNQLVREGGYIGVVLPRSAFAAAGSARWREAMFDNGSFEDVTFLTNNRNWVFPDVHPQYTVALSSYRKGYQPAGVVRTQGPYASATAYQAGFTLPTTEFDASEFRTWTTGAAFPMLPDARSGEVFLKMRRHPRLDALGGDWRVRPVQGDLNSTADKPNMVLDPRTVDGLWPVYAGAAFNLWTPDTGEYYAWADPDHIVAHLQEKRLRQAGRKHSAFSETPLEWCEDGSTLPALRPRIAFRRIARATDSRTMICALAPPMVVMVDTAPYLLFTTGDELDEAFLLGVLSSIPCDWQARRVVETHVDFHVIDAFAVPRFSRDDPLRRRAEQIAGCLAAVDDRYAAWADAVGVPVGSVSTDDERDDLLAELDAVVACLYGLDEDDIVHIFETFHTGWDYGPRLERVRKNFRAIEANVSSRSSEERKST